MMEVWKAIPDKAPYEASSMGRIRGHKGLLSISYSSRYPHVTLYPEKKTYAVHVLIAMTFHGPRPDGFIIRHKDGNHLNNAANNLHYGTRQENEADKIQHGTHRKGTKHPLSKLSEEDVIDIRNRRTRGEKQIDIASYYGISFQHVSDIIKKRFWRHI